MAGESTAARKKTDWDGIEPHYRAGIRSLKDIGAEFEVSDAAIIKHARKAGWDRNLKGKIQARAQAKVSAAVVSAEVSAQAKLTEAVRVEVEAEVSARVQLAHRADIGRARKLSIKLLEELESQTDNLPLFQNLGELLRSEDDRGRDALNDVYQAVLSLPERTKTMKALSETLKNLVGLEREAYGIESLPQTIKAEATVNGIPVDPIEAAKAYRQLIGG